MLKMSILSLLSVKSLSAYVSLNYLENFLPYDNNKNKDDTLENEYILSDLLLLLRSMQTHFQAT